jgi:hypothetical protein
MSEIIPRVPRDRFGSIKAPPVARVIFQERPFTLSKMNTATTTVRPGPINAATPRASLFFHPRGGTFCDFCS